MAKSLKPSVSYIKDAKCIHIETHNCIVNIRHDLTDRLGRPVTSIEVIKDNYIGENKTKLIGLVNTRVVTLKSINRGKK